MHAACACVCVYARASVYARVSVCSRVCVFVFVGLLARGMRLRDSAETRCIRERATRKYNAGRKAVSCHAEIEVVANEGKSIEFTLPEPARRLYTYPHRVRTGVRGKIVLRYVSYACIQYVSARWQKVVPESFRRDISKGVGISEGK